MNYPCIYTALLIHSHVSQFKFSHYFVLNHLIYFTEVLFNQYLENKASIFCTKLWKKERKYQYLLIHWK